MIKHIKWDSPMITMPSQDRLMGELIRGSVSRKKETSRMHDVWIHNRSILKGELLPFICNNDIKIINIDWEKIDACVLHRTPVHISRTIGDKSFGYEKRGMIILYAPFHA